MTVHRLVAIRRGFDGKYLREPREVFDLTLPDCAPLPAWAVPEAQANAAREPFETLTIGSYSYWQTLHNDEAKSQLAIVASRSCL